MDACRVADMVACEEAPRPTPSKGEVLIRVSATPVNPFDCASHAGNPAGYFNHPFPSSWVPMTPAISKKWRSSATAHGVRRAMVVRLPRIDKVLTRVAALVESGQIKPHMQIVLPLREVQQAHRMLGGRYSRGKSVLQVA